MIHLLAATDVLSTVLMLLGVALFGVLLVINLRKRSGGDRGQRMDPRDKLEQMNQVGRTRNDLSTMMVELEELTRRFSAQLDNKSRQVEKLLEEADQRIAELKRLSGRDVQPPAVGEPVKTDRQPNGSSEQGLDPVSQRVYELADAGKDPQQIAGELNEHIGKVELILALRQPT